MFLDKFLELGNFEQTSIRISDFSHDILQTTNVQKLESLSTNISTTIYDCYSLCHNFQENTTTIQAAPAGTKTFHSQSRCIFLLNPKVHKSSCVLRFWAPGPLIDRFLVKSVNQRIWSPKTKAIRTFMKVVI